MTKLTKQFSLWGDASKAERVAKNAALLPNVYASGGPFAIVFGEADPPW